MIPSPRLAACVSIVEVALARPLRVRDELTGAVYVRRGAQGEFPRHHRRDGEKQADVSGSLLVVAAVGPDTEALAKPLPHRLYNNETLLPHPAC